MMILITGASVSADGGKDYFRRYYMHSQENFTELSRFEEIDSDEK